jgi:class 3 adenylate cyclase
MSHPRSFSIFEEDNSSSNQNRSTEIAADSAYEANGEKERDTFTAAESRGVNALKIVVYVTLVFSAIGVGIGAFVFINDEKDVSLNTELGAISDLAALDLESYIHGISTQLSELSTALSSKYQSSDVGKWPNITLPFFDQRIQSNLDSELVFYTPIIATDPAEKAEWEEYGILNQGWIDEDLLHRGWDPITTQISEQIYPYADRSGNIMASFIMTPIWQFSPVPRNRSIVNLDASTHPVIGNVLQSYISGEARGSIMSESLNAAFFLDYVTIDEDQDPSTPRSFLSLPVFNSFNESADPFGYVFALMSWEKALDKAFEGADLQMIVDVQESCGPGFTFTIQNGKSRYITTTQDLDMANPEYAFAYNLFDAACNYTVLIHPTKAALSEISTHVPILAFLIIALLFFLLIGLFNQYSRLVKQRQTKLLMTAKHSRAVVSSLFPEAVRTRLLADVQENEQKQHDTRRAFLQRGGSLNFTKMKEFLEDDREKNVMLQGKPIADFFPEATIMFADLVGFTAWSSMREPTQVFTLLESIYHGFDEIARRRRVFKVETIGDCYVAVAGLPEPCEDHAIVMARFASACRHKMKDIVKVLEVSLGPDTADLAMRIGLHSGPVTAGVLRGDKARFQLFGDTVNTTSRVETTGKRDKIHVSQETAEKLMKAGKVHWLNLREDKVTAKGLCFCSLGMASALALALAIFHILTVVLSLDFRQRRIDNVLARYHSN